MANINEPLQFVMDMSYNGAYSLEQKHDFKLCTIIIVHDYLDIQTGVYRKLDAVVTS
jgi:peptidyl-tRNA hydrolase